MATELTWRPHAAVSYLHAAEVIARGWPLADGHLAEALQVPATELSGEIRALGLSGERFWGHLIPLASRIESRRQLVELAVTKTVGRGPRFETIVANLAARVAVVDAAARGALPNLADEMPLRERPLREQWEARGPGLLSQVGYLTDESLIVPQCEVLLVHPALGGAGEAHLAYNSVRLEAMLANPVAELTEVVRLAWLISQLQLDLPTHSESIHGDRLPHIARFAMLPATLAAAETVELARLTPETVRQAIGAWRLSVPQDVDAAALVMDWWQTYQQTRPPWPVALKALDQLFG
jgi:hypothetical protein